MTALLLLYPQLPMARIVGSDIAHLTRVAGLGHWVTGAIDWGLLGVLLVGSLPGIVIGSYCARRVPETVSSPLSYDTSKSSCLMPAISMRTTTLPPDSYTSVGGVTTFAVTYYDINNVATTTAANVYAVDISITTRSDDATLASYSPANRRATVAGRVRLRNE